ncbi:MULTISPECIES: fibronectin type III domain-containing protein [Bacillus cereus group]|uniref:fibronectin type III domain-containing protein n=1 Tax=Bacillus cereus group TaxID=86661 RepID=UPI00189071D4|nr:MULTISPECIES: fibronectin type III domain-containing protein [Bacillus cereus group]MBJ7935654.1 fibronectin type III domain-containing protein [Bacillus cereus]MEB9420053.1 fibronectin type III domain-containing protein [Bacillus cereus]
MPSLLVPRPEGNWGAAYDVMVTPKINIIMNKVYVQTYNGGDGPIIYRLRISDESTGQVIYDISSTEEKAIADNASKTVSSNIWKDFQDVKMFSGKTYRLSLTTITQDTYNTDYGTHGSSERFNGLSNEHLTIAAASRKYGKSAGQFPEWKFDYTLGTVKGTDIRFGLSYPTYGGDADNQLREDGWKKSTNFNQCLAVAGKPKHTGLSDKVLGEWDSAQSCITFYGDKSTVINGMIDSDGSYIEKIWNHPSGRYMFIFGGRPDERFTGKEAFLSVNDVIKSYAPSGGGMRVVAVEINTGDIVRVGEPKHNIASIAGYYGIDSNKNPSQPLSFKAQPSCNSVNLSDETVEIQWDESTDPEGDTVSYEIEMFNGSTWSPVALNVTTTYYSATLPKLDTDKAQFRVRAVDSKGGKSDYTLGNVFTIATRLLLVQDNNIVKSFKDGVWKTIQ